MPIISSSLLPVPTISPIVLPIRDFATGEANEIEPFFGSLHTPIRPTKSYCTTKDNDIGRRGIRNDLGRSNSLRKIANVTRGVGRKPPSFVHVLGLLCCYICFSRLSELTLQGFQPCFSNQIGVGRNRTIRQQRFGRGLGTFFLRECNAQYDLLQRLVGLAAERRASAGARNFSNSRSSPNTIYANPRASNRACCKTASIPLVSRLRAQFRRMDRRSNSTKQVVYLLAGTSQSYK